MADPRFPHTRVNPSDYGGGNIFNVSGAIGAALRHAGIPTLEIENFYAEVHASQSYSAALDVCGKWVTIEREEDTDHG